MYSARFSKRHMDSYQKVQIIVQIAGIAGLLITIYFHYRNLRLMGVQLEQVQRSTTAGHILSLLSIMEAEDIRMARVLVHTDLHRKHFGKWTEEEIRTASKVCTSYANAGTVLKSGLVPLEPIIESWGFSLRLTYEILEPFIRDMQQSEKVGSAYWADFDWLYQQALDAEARKQLSNDAPMKRRGFAHLRYKNVEKDDAV
jgi:hypothetical protein